MSEEPSGPDAVVLVRHGATEWSEAKRHTGWIDLPLNGDGLAQAKTLTARLAGESFSRVYSSPLQRARMTCMVAGCGARAVIDPDLREWNYGAYEGRTGEEIAEHVPGWTIWSHGVVGGESIDEVAIRADRFIARLRGDRGTVAVFAHGHLLRILGSRWIGQDPRLAQHLSLDTAAVSQLGAEHAWPSITLWNDTAHLRANG